MIGTGTGIWDCALRAGAGVPFGYQAFLIKLPNGSYDAFYVKQSNGSHQQFVAKG